MPHTISRPPGPRTHPPLGAALALRRDVLGFLGDVASRYGDIASFKVGMTNVVLLNHPHFVREVLQTHSANFIKGRPLHLAKLLLGEGLLTSEGARHTQQSHAVQPALRAERVKTYAPIMTECADVWCEGWKTGETRDVMPEMVGLATTISARILFQWEVAPAAAAGIAMALEEATDLFARAPIPLSEWLLKLPLPSSRRFHRAKAIFDDAIYGLIAERRRRPREQADALTMLLEAQRAAPAVISDRLVRDQALTLFVTALDTTSLALTWTWYVLSQHDSVEAKLHDELDTVLAGRRPGIEDVERLPFTRQIVLEAMRLYPPIYAIAREAIAPFEVGGFGIPARSLVLVSPYWLQRDARYFAEPERFLPERWGDARPPGFAYFPFGGGPRGCIGQSYAMLEGVLVLASLARRWRLQHAPGHQVAFRPLINLRPKHGMQMVLHRRGN